MRQKFFVGGPRSWLLILVCLSSVAPFAGCRRTTPTVARVKGKVTLNGQPLSIGNVITLPPSGRGAHGDIASDGSFELNTFTKNDGALIGTHKVAVVAFNAKGKSGPEAGFGKSLVPDRYINPETSNLTIEVKAGETNTPTIELTSP
jgi:hypothetical protein